MVERTSCSPPTGSPAFRWVPMFPLGPADMPMRRLTTEGVEVVEAAGRHILKVAPEAIRLLTRQAFHDCNFFLRPGHLAQLRAILDDPEASRNDHFVALDLLRNAVIASGEVLPMCQDTGTAIALGWKGQSVWTEGHDEEAISHGVYDTYVHDSLRYSQLAPLGMFEEVNTKCNLPAHIEIEAVPGMAYDFLFVAKGGGSANKTFLHQVSPALLREDALLPFLDEKLRDLGTAACPPYHLAVVVGGPSAEFCLKTVKLASTRFLDGLPTQGSPEGHAFRDLGMEARILEMTRKMGIGAQFGGKYFCHDVRVIRLPRHGASLPIGIGVSCSADRQVLGRIDEHGVHLEELERDPARFLPDVTEDQLGGEAVAIDLDRGMDAVRSELTKHPVGTRLSLTGTMVVARDLAHARLRRILEETGELPEWFREYPVYYAGPAKKPEGMPSGSFGPTTAARMDPYVDLFQAHGGSLVMLAKGNRSRRVVLACEKHGGFYLGSIGGPAARLAQDCIEEVECLAFPELGMEAAWRIRVRDFPAFIVTDDKGNDFFLGLTSGEGPVEDFENGGFSV